MSGLHAKILFPLRNWHRDESRHLVLNEQNYKMILMECNDEFSKAYYPDQP
jgi:hypothetical protein